LATGNTYIQQQDIRLPGLGGGLTLSRIWYSLWPSSQIGMKAGLFGNNWRSTYEERVFLGDDETVKYSRADGSFWSFLLYGDPATYQVIAPANERATMVYGATEWTISFVSGEKRTFSHATGSLTSIVDRNGNTTQLSYDNLNRLTTVTDPAGRHLYFTYPDGSSYLVNGVSSDFGISLSYAYDSQQRLTQVTRPDNTYISFEYSPPSLITAVKDNEGKVLESHTYDSSGRGLTSSRANGVEAVTVSSGGIP
jgi:YD repeat-containing protein